MITATTLLKTALDQTRPEKRRSRISGLGMLGTAGGALLGGAAGGAVGAGAGLPLVVAGDFMDRQQQIQAAQNGKLQQQLGPGVPLPPTQDGSILTTAGTALPIIGAGAGLLGGGMLAYQALKRDPHDDEQEA